MKWLKETYSGYLWPWLIFFPGMGYGLASEAHSAWRYAQWPSLAVSLFATAVVAGKLKKAAKK